VKLPRHDGHHRHVHWRRRRRRRDGNVAGIAFMVGSVVDVKGVTGNDDDAQPAPTTGT